MTFFRLGIPILVDYMFNKALPYAWWSRGNVRQAEKAFMKLVHQLEEGYFKRDVFCTIINNDPFT